MSRTKRTSWFMVSPLLMRSIRQDQEKGVEIIREKFWKGRDGAAPSSCGAVENTRKGYNGLRDVTKPKAKRNVKRGASRVVRKQGREEVAQYLSGL